MFFRKNIAFDLFFSFGGNFISFYHTIGNGKLRSHTRLYIRCGIFEPLTKSVFKALLKQPKAKSANTLET